MVRGMEQKGWFTVPQVAKMFGVRRQSVYDAVNAGRLRAAGTGWDRRIHAEDVIGYAIRTGRDVSTVVQRMEQVSEEKISGVELLGWALAALGLVWLITKLND